MNLHELNPPTESRRVSGPGAARLGMWDAAYHDEYVREANETGAMLARLIRTCDALRMAHLDRLPNLALTVTPQEYRLLMRLGAYECNWLGIAFDPREVRFRGFRVVVT